MTIAANKVVSFHYTLKDSQDEVLENSREGDPMAYLHGHGNIIAGLEKAFEGKAEGEQFSVTLAPADAYGERVEGSIQRIPMKHLHAPKGKLRAGMVVGVETDQGIRQVTVLKVGKFNVDVDTNHPLAGETLTFEIDVVSVRDASEEEISHGHAHGVGGHQH